jgi:hypothetical protein
MKNTETVGPGPALVGAVRRALAPLGRLLIAKGVPFPAMAEMLKGIYVDVAAHDFPVDGRPQTDSRIHLLTGVHRKDVKRLREAPAEATETPKRASLSTQIIARWTTRKPFLDGRRRPRPLARTGTDGASFEDLVRSVNTDIRPRVVLDELQRLGIVRIDADDRVHLESAAFVPEPGSDELAFYFGRNLHDHFAAGVHNLLGGTPRCLERSVAYNNLSAEAVAELEELARRVGMEALQQVNERALALQERDAGRADADRRMNFGLYFFAETQPQDDDDAQ